MEDTRNYIIERMISIEKETPNDFEFGNKVRALIKEISKKSDWSIEEIEKNIIQKKINT
jgi:hypothetical protein